MQSGCSGSSSSRKLLFSAVRRQLQPKAIILSCQAAASSVLQCAEQDFIHKERFDLAPDDSFDFPGAEFSADALLLYQLFCRGIGGQLYIFPKKHLLQPAKLFLHNLLRHFIIHAVEYHNPTQTVAEFRLESTFDFLQQDIRADILSLEADAVLSNPACTGI